MDVDKSPQKTPKEPSPPKKKQKTIQQTTPKINIQIPKGFNMKQLFNPPKNNQNANNTNKDQLQSIQQQIQTNPSTAIDTTSNITNIPPFKSPPNPTMTPPNPRQKSTSNTKTKQKQNTTNTKANKPKTGNKPQTKTSIKPSSSKLKKRPEPKKQTATITIYVTNPRWDPMM